MNKLGSYIGLCMAAGGVSYGTDSVLGCVRSGKTKFVIIASDVSDRTRKQISDKCASYNVRLYTPSITCEELGLAIGKKSLCAACAFTGKGPAKMIAQLLESESSETAVQENNV